MCNAAESNAAAEAKAWRDLEALARQINPDLPADLAGQEIRITLSKDFQAVEVINLDALARQRWGWRV